MSTKEQMVEAIRSLPEDATVRDAIARLEIIVIIEQGIAAADAGKTVTQAEARQTAARWLD